MFDFTDDYANPIHNNHLSSNIDGIPRERQNFYGKVLNCIVLFRRILYKLELALAGQDLGNTQIRDRWTIGDKLELAERLLCDQYVLSSKLVKLDPRNGILRPLWLEVDRLLERSDPVF